MFRHVLSRCYVRPRNDSEEVEVQGERLNNKADNEGFVEVRS